MQNMLANEMKKIDELIKQDKLSDHQKVRRQLREKGGGDKDVEARLFEIKSKNFTCSFKTYTRDQRNKVLDSKMSTPGVGLYHPKKELVL